MEENMLVLISEWLRLQEKVPVDPRAGQKRMWIVYMKV
jgi:hypothetical protein